MSTRNSYAYKQLPTIHYESSGRLINRLLRFLCLSKQRRRCFIGLLVLFCVIVYFCKHLYLFRDFIYIIRPVFDKDVAFEEIPNFANSRLNGSTLCALHGWKERPSTSPPIRIIDATLFSLELELLELRLRELWNEVDLFLVLEADRTFSGQPKALILQANLAQFAWASAKLRVETVSSLAALRPGESPWANEIRMRDSMTDLVRRHARPGDLVLTADIDEIPRSSTVRLIRACAGYADPLHFRFRKYMYSFEYPIGFNDAWRAKVETFHPATFLYSHGKRGNVILADAGWHCTFCFRYLRDFRWKMTAYSHNDRLMGRSELLENEEIQRRICSGLDVFDMYPEVYSFREMVALFGPLPKATSFIDLPMGLAENREKFAFLLKGGCIRKDYSGTLKV